MKVKVKVEWQEAEQTFYEIPKEQREGAIFWSSMGFMPNKQYDVLSVEEGPGGGEWYRIIDESGEDYLFPSTMFEVVEE